MNTASDAFDNSSSRASPGYRTCAYWYPHPDGWVAEPVTETHPTLAEAERSGQQWGCLHGVRRVEVYAPDNTLQALWDKETVHATLTPWHYDDDTGEVLWDRSYLRNRWQRVGAESQRIEQEEQPQQDGRQHPDGKVPAKPQLGIQ